MAIYLSSRYESAVVDFLAFSAPDVAAPVVFYQFPDIGRISYTEYVCKEGDRIDQISTKFYNYPESWWIIAQANPKINFHGVLKAGEVLKIPNV